MLVAMTAMLVSVAELSNILSVLAVLICFCGMVLFIMRNMTVFWLHGEELMFGSSVHHVQPRIPQMKMMKVHIPFTFKLQETSKSSYKAVSNNGKRFDLKRLLLAFKDDANILNVSLTEIYPGVLPPTILVEKDKVHSMYQLEL